MLPFSLAAGLSCPTHADLAAALAAEFRPVDEAAVDEALDALAARMAPARDADPRGQLDAVASAMAAFEPLQAPLDARALLIDVALDRLSGHPTVLAVIAAEAGRRAGLDVSVAAARGCHLVAYRGGGETVAFDPAKCAVRDVRSLRATWRCSHQVAFALLREQLDRALRAGDIAGALRAAELRLDLPLERSVQDRLRLELASIRAALN